MFGLETPPRERPASCSPPPATPRPIRASRAWSTRPCHRISTRELVPGGSLRDLGPWRAADPARPLERDRPRARAPGQPRPQASDRAGAGARRRDRRRTTRPRPTLTFLELLAERLEERHSVAPVHTLDELRDASRAVPRADQPLGRARSRAASARGDVDLRPRAGRRPRPVRHRLGRGPPQTPRSTSCSRRRSSGRAAGGARYFSFGASTEREGTVLNSRAVRLQVGLRRRFGRPRLLRDRPRRNRMSALDETARGRARSPRSRPAG